MNISKLFVVGFLYYLSSLGLCFAQSPKDFIKEEPYRTDGSFYVYDYKTTTPMTPAPEGYSPFYISHFGRHGARWCTSEYDQLYEWFSKAAAAGVLTDAGQDFFSRYEAYYNKVRYCRGNLSAIGKDQLRTAAGRVCSRFPAVFEGPTHVEAVSTESARVIMSMWSFLFGLQANDSDIDVNADASGKYAPWLQPSLSTNPYLIKGSFRCGKPAEEAYAAYFGKTVPWQEIAGRFFTSADVLGGTLNVTPAGFIETLQSVVVCTRCLEEDRGCFDDVFSPEEMYLVWKAVSARYFMEMGRFATSQTRFLDYAAFTLQQIIETADEDMASGSTQLRLRFGHDSGIAPLLILLDVNGYGRATSSFEESLEIFPSWCLPMGASLQLVFYRNDAGDILLKALVNEREATLPFAAVCGPYYSWNDFKAYYMPAVEDSIRSILSASGNASTLPASTSVRP